MNKEFRVWDGIRFLWPTEFCLFPEDNGTFLPRRLAGYGELRDIPNSVILQYTGLTDSTGKKIFEGDIVCEKMTDDIAFEGGECNLGRVFFAAGTFMIDGDGPLFDHTFSLTPDRLEDYLVVGNIFENPELLK